MTKRPASPIEALLVPPAALYAGAMKVRNAAYDRSWFQSFDPGVPVVSVGNLTAGGTGKTPLTEMIVRELCLQGVKPGIISRGYRGEIQGEARVPAIGSGKDALYFGDEPSWLAERFPEVPVYVGRDKVAVCHKLRSENKVDLIIADDAFQHRRLRRKFDVVVIDATGPLWHYRSLPLGRMREGFDSLLRAQAVFLSKTNLAKDSDLQWLREKIQATLSGRKAPTVYEFRFAISEFHRLGDPRQTMPATAFKGARVLLASGIGRPATFAKLVGESTGAEVLDHLVFADHHPYSAQDLEAIAKRAQALGAEKVIVTEKDEVKWRELPMGAEVWVSRLKSEPLQDLKGFYATLGRLVL